MKILTAKELALDIAMLAGTAIAIMTALFADFTKNCDEARESFFRLHIIANSDSDYDQSVKTALRDYMISDFGGYFSSCGSAKQSKRIAEENIGLIEESANTFLRSRGCDYGAVCVVGKSEFPTRKYGDTTLPAGEYEALRIVLGEGKGKNWWCVLYPSMCVSAASVKTTPFPVRTMHTDRERSARLTAEAGRTDIEFKFALYELIRSWFAGG